MGIMGAISGACAGAYAGAEVGLKGTWIFNPALAIPGAAVGAIVGAVAGEKMMFAVGSVVMGVTVGTVKVAGKVVIWPFQQLANGIQTISDVSGHPTSVISMYRMQPIDHPNEALEIQRWTDEVTLKFGEPDESLEDVTGNWITYRDTSGRPRQVLFRTRKVLLYQFIFHYV